MCLVFTEVNNVVCNYVKQPHGCEKDVKVEQNYFVIIHSAEMYTTKTKDTG